MASEAVTPITSIQEPGLQGMPRTYTSQREVPAEWEPPLRGSVVGDILPRYKTHIVLDAQVIPKGGKRVAVIAHCSPPSWVILTGSQDRLTSDDAFIYNRQVVLNPTQDAIEADPFSTYQPYDETKSIKTTKVPRRKKADGTYEDGYPQQQAKDKTDPNQPPGRFHTEATTIETATVEVLDKANVSDIPAPAAPSGDEIKVSHQKLNDEQYRKTIIEEIIATGPNLGTSIDSRTGNTFLETVEVVPAATVAGGSTVGADGSVVTYEPVNTKWSLKVTRKAVDTAIRQWTDIVNYEWPAVLQSILFDVYDHKSGGSAIYPSAFYKEGFTGPQKAEVTQYWQKTAPTVIPQLQMIPQGFQFACPLYNLRVSACLHPAVTLTCNIGTEDPDWEMAAVSRTFAATNYLDWPEQVFWRESKPYMGGYLVTEYTIQKPS